MNDAISEGARRVKLASLSVKGLTDSLTELQKTIVANQPIPKYKKLVDSLIEMKEEYKLNPSEFLLNKIELAETKLKKIDSMVANFTNSGGVNYKQVYTHTGTLNLEPSEIEWLKSFPNKE